MAYYRGSKVNFLFIVFERATEKKAITWKVLPKVSYKNQSVNKI